MALLGLMKGTFPCTGNYIHVHDVRVIDLNEDRIIDLKGGTALLNEHVMIIRLHA